MDRALEVGDACSFDKWRLIAETIAALGRINSTNGVEQVQPHEGLFTGSRDA